MGNSEKKLETYHFANQSPQPNRLCVQIEFKNIFQDGGGGHLGLMCEQDLKVRKNVRNYFLIRNSQRQLILHIVLEKLKIYIF